jgi:hypothetical protein
VQVVVKRTVLPLRVQKAVQFVNFVWSLKVAKIFMIDNAYCILKREERQIDLNISLIVIRYIILFL